MSSLYQRGEVWYISLMVNGTNKCMSLKTRSKIEAKRRATVIELELQGKSIDQLLYPWLKSGLVSFIDARGDKRTERSPRYISDVKTHFNSFLDYHGRKKSSTSVTYEELTIYRMYLINEGLADSTIGIRMRSIRVVFSHAYKIGLIPNNPFKGFKIPTGSPRSEYLELKEIEKLLKAAKGNLLHQQYILFMLRTGCRIGEFKSLKWKDVYNKYIEFNGKTGMRRFPRMEKVDEVIKEIEKHLKVKGEYVYTNIYGIRNEDKNHLSRMIKHYIRKAKLNDKYCAYTLRHTFGSQLVVQGEDIYKVSKLMGHQSITTTEKHYLHLKPEEIEVELNF